MNIRTPFGPRSKRSIFSKNLTIASLWRMSVYRRLSNFFEWNWHVLSQKLQLMFSFFCTIFSAFPSHLGSLFCPKPLQSVWIQISRDLVSRKRVWQLTLWCSIISECNLYVAIQETVGSSTFFETHLFSFLWSTELLLQDFRQLFSLMGQRGACWHPLNHVYEIIRLVSCEGNFHVHGCLALLEVYSIASGVFNYFAPLSDFCKQFLFLRI